ncbi:uncharacterized protein LOC126718416 [Quercus robur]|uniref:uncharacterized protein LOC126718416 n=1 Tax=Quercus robur TaxID=38942 RepID=UPI002162AE9C|nr:uncharacterized protein LOC126718416 [Quercus robur]XP_050276551.1 uncharacterized protein LOC126718416 [Quercus robur]
MGRLKAGQSMYKPQPLPQAVRVKPNTKTKTKSPPSRTRTRKSKLNLYKRKKQKQEDEDEEETNGNNNNNNNNNNSNDDDLVTVAVVPATGDVSGEVPGPLSLLRKFPNNSSANSNNLNQLAPATRELYAKTAESLKKLLVSELSPWSGDVETMVASANRAFETLDWLQPDYTEFYDAVRAVLSRRAQLSYFETELRTHQNEESGAVSSFQARLKEAVEAVARSEAEYWKAIERVSGLKNRVSEIRKALKNLELESAWGEEVVLADRKREWEQCLESHLAIKKEERELADQMEEKQKTIEKIKRLRDEADAGVQGSIKALSSLC